MPRRSSFPQVLCRTAILLALALAVTAIGTVVDNEAETHGKDAPESPVTAVVQDCAIIASVDGAIKHTEGDTSLGSRVTLAKDAANSGRTVQTTLQTTRSTADRRNCAKPTPDETAKRQVFLQEDATSNGRTVTAAAGEFDYEDEVFDTLKVMTSSVVTLRRCTVTTLKINSAGGSLQLLAEDSEIGGVEATARFLGNATFVGCSIGVKTKPRHALSFLHGTGQNSTISVINTTVFANHHGATFGSTHGSVVFIDSTVSVRAALDGRGLSFDEGPIGDVRIIRCRVTSVLSTGDAVFFEQVRGSARIENSTLGASTLTSNFAVGLSIENVDPGGCVWISGGSIVARSAETQPAITQGVLVQNNKGGAVSITHGTTIKSEGSALSIGVELRNEMINGATVLLRDVDVTASSHYTAPDPDATRAFHFGYISDSTIVLESTTLRSAKGVCMYLPKPGKSVPESGVVDMRGLNFALCSKVVEIQNQDRPLSAIEFHQSCVRLPNSPTFAREPLVAAARNSTTVFPCVNGQPRQSPVSTKADVIGKCAVLGDMSPFRIPIDVSMRGSVHLSNERFDSLTIEDPEDVVLSNLHATVIRFTKSGVSVPKSPPRVKITDSVIHGEGVHFAAAPFPDLDLTIEDSSITAADLKSAVPLLTFHTVRRGSIILRNVKLNGRLMLKTSTLTDTIVSFQNASFIATPCASCGTVEERHIACDSLFRSSFTLNGCRFRSASAATKTPIGTMVRFDSLKQANVSIIGTSVSSQSRRPSRFFDVNDVRASCITISDTTVTQSCSHACIQSEPSYFFSASKAPTGSSYLTLDNVNITMATYSATAVYMPYLQNIDVVMSRVNAVVNPQDVSSNFFKGTNAKRAVVALLDSTVSVREGTAYRIGAVIEDVSLLTSRSRIDAPRVMHDNSSTLNARYACSVFSGNRSSLVLGRSTTCVDRVSPSCVPVPSIYAALHIDLHDKRALPESHPETDSSKAWIIYVAVGGCVGIIALGLLIFFQKRCHDKITEQNTGKHGDDAGQVGNPGTDFEEVGGLEEEELAAVGDVGVQAFSAPPSEAPRSDERRSTAYHTPGAASHEEAHNGSNAVPVVSTADVRGRRRNPQRRSSVRWRDLPGDVASTVGDADGVAHLATVREDLSSRVVRHNDDAAPTTHVATVRHQPPLPDAVLDRHNTRSSLLTSSSTATNNTTSSNMTPLAETVTITVSSSPCSTQVPTMGHRTPIQGLAQPEPRLPEAYHARNASLNDEHTAHERRHNERNTSERDANQSNTHEQDSGDTTADRLGRSVFDDDDDGASQDDEQEGAELHIENRDPHDAQQPEDQHPSLPEDSPMP